MYFLSLVVLVHGNTAPIVVVTAKHAFFSMIQTILPRRYDPVFSSPTIKTIKTLKKTETTRKNSHKPHSEAHAVFRSTKHDSHMETCLQPSDFMDPKSHIIATLQRIFSEALSPSPVTHAEWSIPLSLYRTQNCLNMSKSQWDFTTVSVLEGLEQRSLQPALNHKGENTAWKPFQDKRDEWETGKDELEHYNPVTVWANDLPGMCCAPRMNMI